MTAEEILADYFCDCGLAGRGSHKSFCHSREMEIANLVGEVEQALTAAVAEEAAKKTCAGHGRPLCACYGCIKDFKAEAAAEAEAVAHATGRLNMALAVETERERCASVAENESSCFCVEEYLARNKHAGDCLWKEGQDIAAAIREEVKP